MIFGIGIDIIEVERIAKQVHDSSSTFIQKIFTEKEIAYCETKIKNKAQNYAARFAAKEAFFKAIGTGWRNGFRWQDIEVENDDLGKPMVAVSGTLKSFVEKKNILNIHVSLSHVKEMAVALVILEN